MAEAYLGQIIGVGFKFAPVGWAVCDGSLLSISGNEGLFSLLGTRYGGDGITTFAIPDLRGRIPIHQGQGVGLSNYDLGQKGGGETQGLLEMNIGSHTHTLMAAAPPAEPTVSPDPGPTRALTTNQNAKVNLYGEGAADVVFGLGALWSAGYGQPHENRQPFQVINYIICLAGLYPSQS